MIQYEYKILAADARGGFFSGGGRVNFEALQDELNRLGKLGWEMVASTNINRYEGATRDVMIILKRPINENQQA